MCTKLTIMFDKGVILIKFPNIFSHGLHDLYYGPSYTFSNINEKEKGKNGFILITFAKNSQWIK